MKFLLIAVMSLVLSTCETPTESKPVSPPTTCTYEAGRNNFVWDADTVALPGSDVNGLWVFSDTNAFLMGHIYENKPGQNSWILGIHWNGKEWNSNIYGEPADIGMGTNAIAGDENIMMCVGSSGRPAISEFDNRTKKWKKHNLNYQEYGELRSVWTDGKGFYIAAGDNGMIFTKENANSGWVYHPTKVKMNFYSIYGVSKIEFYLYGYDGQKWDGLYRYNGVILDTLFWGGYPDSKNKLKLTQGADVGSFYGERCSITDSLTLYVSADNGIYRFKSKGQQLVFTKEKLNSKWGLPNESMGFYFFNSNNIWFFGSNLRYIWNGESLTYLTLPYLTNNNEIIQGSTFKYSSARPWLPIQIYDGNWILYKGK